MALEVSVIKTPAGTLYKAKPVEKERERGE